MLAMAITLPILTGSELRSGESTHPIEFACPPIDDADLEHPADCGLSGKATAIIGLGLGLLGYVFGRASVKTHDPAKVRSDVEAVFADRKDEAARHGVPGAIPLLDQARDDVLAALRRLGVIG